MVENFIPSVLARYRQQILFPILRLLLAVLMSLGTDNQYAINQVTAVTFVVKFLLSVNRCVHISVLFVFVENEVFLS